MMQSAWCVAGAAASLLVMVSTASPQGFCSGLDEVIKLTPSRFRSIREHAGRDTLTVPVTRNLPGAAWCWYDEMLGAYWCA